MSTPVALMMVQIYAAVLLVARGVLARLLYRYELSSHQRTALALNSGTQLSLVVAITLTLILFPAIAQPFLQAHSLAHVLPDSSLPSGDA